MVATIGLLVLPSESVRLFPDNHALMLGVMLGSTGLTQLVAPLAGYYSDRCTSGLGKRRPYILHGSLLQLAGIVAMYWCRQQSYGVWYVLALFMACVGMNLAFAAFSALVQDSTSQEQLGRASGVMAIMQMTGALLGFYLFGFVLDIVWAYHIYVVCTTCCLCITMYMAIEEPLDAQDADPVIWKEVLAVFWIDRTTHEDFFWVFILRTLYYMAVSIQAFVLFYLRDVTGVSNPAYYTSILAMFAQISAAIIAYPAGRLSDKTGRKFLVVLACVSMASVYMGFLFVGALHTVLMLGFLYGFGNGTFLSVDYALAVDVLPDKSRAAQDLGTWGTAAFLGSTFGSLINGVLLNFVGSDSPFMTSLLGHIGESQMHGTGYEFRGYVALMSAGTFWLVLASLCLLKIDATPKH
jgi:MFS family permease